MAKGKQSPEATTLWKSRIIGHGSESPEQLLANPWNARRHPGPQRDAMRGSLDAVGWVAEVTVNVQTQHVVDGHLRIEEAISHNEPTVPVAYVDLTESEERLVLATLDPLSAMATYDPDALKDLLDGLSSGSAGLDALLADLAEKSGVLLIAPEPPIEFPTPDDSVEFRCPRCGYEWSGQAAPPTA